MKRAEPFQDRAGKWHDPLDKVVDGRPLPGAEPPSLESELLAAGVEPEQLAAVRAVVVSWSMKSAGEYLRRVFDTLGQTPAGIALRRAVLGDDGRSYAEDAALAGISKQSLQVSVTRLLRRLARIGG